MKTLILCADDYALSPAISRGIIALAEAGCISAISCMSASPYWPEHARWLQPLRERIDVGLHLCLTDLAPLDDTPVLAPEGRPPSLGSLLAKALAHRLPAGEVARELDRQMQCFIDHFGATPDFLDGHQHIHVLPGVREATLTLWDRHLKPQGGYLRSCVEPTGAILHRGITSPKALFISALSRRFTHLAHQRGALLNDSFRGVHDFSGSNTPQQLFSRFLQGEGERPLVMCHPGLSDPEAKDALRDWRPLEYAYLMGDEFENDLERADVQLGRLAR